MNKRIGLYSWAGPGTIRMIDLKYFSPKIDKESVMQAYDYEYLAQAKEKFGITDIWVTYSWGFSPQTEQEDYDFLASKLAGMHKLGLKVHAYLQGMNLVYDEFPNHDWWCEDQFGQLIPYHRGRRQVNPLSNEFREYKLKQIRDLANLGVDGGYIDNIAFGTCGTGFVNKSAQALSFFGDNSQLTRTAFAKYSGGMQIPVDIQENTEVTEKYLNFRQEATTEFVREMAAEAHKFNLEFGTNSFDPRRNTSILFGTDIKALAGIQDYLLFENYNLPDSKGNRSNKYIDDFVQDVNIPAFVVSYSKAIGHENAFSQARLDLAFAETEKYKFNICLKGSEYTSHGVWYNLRVADYQRPNKVELPVPQSEKQRDTVEKWLQTQTWIARLLDKYFNRLALFYFESRVGRRVLDILYRLGVS